MRKSKKQPTELLARHDHQAIHFDIPTFYTEKRFMVFFLEPMGVGLIEVYWLVSGDSLCYYYISRLSLMAGRCLATHLGFLVYIYEDHVSFRDTLRTRRLGMIFFIGGVPARQDLQRRRRLWEGDSTTDAFVTIWGEIIERVALPLGCQQKTFTMGKDMRRGDTTCTITPCYAYTPYGRALLITDARDGVA